MPSLQGEAEGTNLQELTASTMDDDHAFNPNTNQLSDELLTLSLVPRSRWQTLLNLDTIKVRPILHLLFVILVFIFGVRSHANLATEQTQGASEGAGKGSVLPSHPSGHGGSIRRHKEARTRTPEGI